MPKMNAAEARTDTSRGMVPGSLAMLNAAAVAVAALYFGRELLVPMVLAVLLAFVLAPAVVLLQRARLGRTLPVFIAVLLAFAVIGGIGLVVYRQAASLAGGLETYQTAILAKVARLPIGHELSAQLTASLSSVLGKPDHGLPSTPSLQSGLQTSRTKVAVVPLSAHGTPATPNAEPTALVIARTVVQPLLGPLATFGVVLIFVIFVLLFREDLRDRLVRLMGRQDLHRTILAMNDAARRLSRFFLFQVAINAGFGAFIGAGLATAGLPNPVLWGILAALMRFVPFLGTFIAGAPPLLLALAVSPGWGLALAVLLLFAISELIMGQVIEPLLYGHSTGLSPIAVILAATFWAFLWGPVGLLLATPLTVCLVVIGRHVESLQFLEVMLGDGPPLDAEETFYQRALEGNGRVLADQARQAVARTGLPDYYDRVALRGLSLAQSDLARDALAFDRLEAVHQQIDTLLTTLGQTAAPADATPPPPAGWREDGAILCIPARGQLDDLAAKMAMQVLQGAGFGARCDTNLILGARQAAPETLAHVRLVCLSVLEQGSSPSAIRYLLRRIARQMPNAVAVVGLWHADGESPTLAALRAEGTQEMIVLSLGELAALTKAVSARRARLAA
jgi:predicted PurR-regulated permease PerM